jgi:hypothetical protein
MEAAEEASLVWKFEGNVANFVLTFIYSSTCPLFYGYIYVVTWQLARP